MDFDESNMEAHIQTFVKNWKGPVFSALKESTMINLDLCDKTALKKFFKENADNYISRHDISLFKKWSVKLIQNILSKIRHDDNLKYTFIIHLLTTHPNNENHRFVLGKTFRAISMGVDGVKWINHFQCNDFNFKEKVSLQKFVNLLQQKLRNQKKNRKRKFKQMENATVDEKSYECKMQKIHEIFLTLNQLEQQKLLVNLMNEMPPKKRLKK